MEFRELRSLVMLTETGSIRRAAQLVHLTPPSVHKHLKALEAEFGLRLYERKGRNLKLTAAAEAMLPYLHNVVADYETAKRALDEWKGVQRGIVNVGSGPVVGEYVVAAVLERFFARYPRINITIHTGSVRVLVEELSSGTLDLAFLAVPELEAEQRAALDSFDVICEVMDLAMVLVSGTPMGRRRYSLAELQHLPFVRYDDALGISRVVQRYFAEAGFWPRAAVRCDYTETMKAMVQKIKGLSLLPLWVVEDDVRAGRLWIVRQVEPPLTLKIVLACRKGRVAPPAVRALIEVIRGFKIAGGKVRPSGRRRRPRAGS